MCVCIKWNITYESESRSVMSNSLPPLGLYSPWNSPGQNTGVGSLFLQGIFPTQGLNPSILHCRQILYQLSYKGSPYIWGLPLVVQLVNYIYNGILLSCKQTNNEITSFAAIWMDLEIIILSEVGQIQRKTNIIWYCSYVESKTGIQVNLSTK